MNVHPSRILSSLLSCWLLGLAAVFAMCSPMRSAAQENQPPTSPGEIVISEITAHSVRISWGEATDPNGDALFYLVWLRKRVNGIAQPWMPPHQTRTTSLVWDGLTSSTLYEVKVAASDGKVPGPARLKENAFTTLAGDGENHPPSTPRSMEFGPIAAHSVKIWWGLSTDPDNDPILYQISLRKRTEGEVSEWLPFKTSTANWLVWEGVEAESLYDARVRAYDGKSFSRWFVREYAFRTPPELNAPTRPGEITVSLVTVSSARVAWGAARGPLDATLVYEVQLRPRREGAEWRTVAETTELFANVGNLPAGTMYDVRVRAWAKGIAGIWSVKENAFVTLRADEINHPPGTPGPVEVVELTPFSVRMVWRAAVDPDGDRLTYSVCLRKRVEGVAQPWSPARETVRPGIVWEGLTPSTVYEVRIRAWDGKAYSDYYLKEQAFRTPAVGARLLNFVGHSDPEILGGQQNMLVVWPDDGSEGSMETAEKVGQWVPLSEVMTDGTNNRATVPMSTDARFFRIRK